MKKYLLIIFLLAFNLTHAQQLTQYTQYTLNSYGLNPATGGTPGCVEAKVGSRRQWIGFDAAPRSSFLSIYSFIGKHTANPRKGRHCVGGYIEFDQTGPNSRIGIYPSYSYHLPLSRTTYGAVGLFAGIMQYRFDVNYVEAEMANDNVLQGSKSSLLYPDINPAALIYSKNFFIGISIKNIAGNKLDKVYGEQSRLSRHFYFHAGYRILTSNKSFSLIPSTIIKFAPFGTPAIDLNLMVDYRNKIAVGISYRNVDAIAALLRVSLGRSIILGYSFDYTLSQIKVASSNSHEVILGIKFCKNKLVEEKEICPAYQ